MAENPDKPAEIELINRFFGHKNLKRVELKEKIQNLENYAWVVNINHMFTTN